MRIFEARPTEAPQTHCFDIHNLTSGPEQNVNKSVLDASLWRFKFAPTTGGCCPSHGPPYEGHAFAATVDQVRLIAQQDSSNLTCVTILKLLEKKLSDDYAEKWLDIRGLHNTGKLEDVADFLMTRQTRRLHLQRGLPEKMVRVRPILAVQEDDSSPQSAAEPEPDTRQNRHSGESRQISVLLDSGSSVTLVYEELARNFNMIGDTFMMALTWADGRLQRLIRLRSGPGVILRTVALCEI